MPDATDEAFAKLQAGAAPTDPTEAAFAQMQAGGGTATLKRPASGFSRHYRPATPAETEKVALSFKPVPPGMTFGERAAAEWDGYVADMNAQKPAMEEALSNISKGEILHDPVGFVRDVGRGLGGALAPVTSLYNRAVPSRGRPELDDIPTQIARLPLDAPGVVSRGLEPMLGEKGAEAAVTAGMMFGPGLVKGLRGVEPMARPGAPVDPMTYGPDAAPPIGAGPGTVRPGLRLPAPEASAPLRLLQNEFSKGEIVPSERVPLQDRANPYAAIDPAAEAPTIETPPPVEPRVPLDDVLAATQTPPETKALNRSIGATERGEAARLKRIKENAPVSPEDADLENRLRRVVPDSALPKQRPLQGNSMRRGGSQSGELYIPDARELAKKAEGWIEAAEKPLAAGARKLGAAVSTQLPAATGLANAAYDKMLSSPERTISAGFDSTIQKGRAAERGLSIEAKKAVIAFEKATEGLSPEQVDQVGRSLASQTADLSTLDPAVRSAVEQTRATLQTIRGRETQAGGLSPEALGEYPEGHLKRIRKEGIVPTVKSMLSRTGGLSAGPYDMAQDMYTVTTDLGADAAKKLATGPVRYVKDHGGKTLLQWTDSPEGLAARDAFAKAIKGEHSYSTTDPIPEAKAKSLFVNDPAKRLHVTMQESARRIGKLETLRDISKLTDEKGPVAQAPKNIGRAARGLEAAPDGMEFLHNPRFGDLHNKFVRTDVAEYVRGAFSPEAKGFTNGLSQGLMERFKVARLLYNPRQWVRQIPSNMEFENLMGVSNWGPRYIAHKIRGLQAMREGSPYRAALEANGFLDPAYVSEAELGLAETELGGKGNAGRRVGRAIGSFGLTEIAPGKLKAVESALGRAYGAADAWTKATGYVHAIEELKMSPDEAAAYVRKWTPSPESVSDLVKGYSRSILGDPWARYKAEQIRINGHAAAEKPIRLAMNLNQKNLIRGTALTLGASALSDDEDEAIENEQGGGALTLGRNDKGEPMSLDYSFLSTIGDILYDTPSELGKNDAPDSLARKAVGAGGEHLVERMMDISGVGNNPLYSIATEQLTRRDKYGRPVNPEGTTEGAASAAGSELLKSWLPSLATNHRQKLVAAFKGEPFSPNQPVQTKTQAIFDVFFGFKLTPLQADQAMKKLQRQGARAIGDIEHEFKAQAIRGEAIDMDRANSLANTVMKEYEERAAPLERIKKAETK